MKVSDFLVPTLIQLSLAAGAIAAVMAVSGETVKTVEVISLSALFPLLLINITSGPMGEELGWRAYALQEL